MSNQQEATLVDQIKTYAAAVVASVIEGTTPAGSATELIRVKAIQLAFNSSDAETKTLLFQVGLNTYTKAWQEVMASQDKQTETKYTYFVSYQLSSHSGVKFGRCEMFRHNPVTSLDDIVGMESAIEKNHPGCKALVMNFQLLNHKTDCN